MIINTFILFIISKPCCNLYIPTELIKAFKYSINIMVYFFPEL